MAENPKTSEHALTEEQIKYMVDRFLGWRLPENFNPDAGISFKREFNEHTSHPMKHEPTGTNLFDATQAEAMVRYLVDGMPDVAQLTAPSEREAQLIELIRNMTFDKCPYCLGSTRNKHNPTCPVAYALADCSSAFPSERLIEKLSEEIERLKSAYEVLASTITERDSRGRRLRRVEELLATWQKRRDMNGDCTRLYAIDELKAALADSSPQSSAPGPTSASTEPPLRHHKWGTIRHKSERDMPAAERQPDTLREAVLSEIDKLVPNDAHIDHPMARLYQRVGQLFASRPEAPAPAKTDSQATDER